MNKRKIIRLLSYVRPFFTICESKILKKNIPLRIDLNVTNRCNLRCSYCYIDFEDFKRKKDLTTQQIKEIIKGLHSHGMFSIRLMGGEPLLRDDTGEILDFIRSKHILCEINTNGYLVKKWIKELKKVDSVCLSLDGDEKSNDIVRGKGCYQKVIETLKLLLSYNIPTRIHAMLSKYTMNSLRHIAELSRRYGVSFTYAPCCVPDLDQRDPNLSLTLDEFVNFFNEYLKLKQEGYPVLTSYQSIKLAINWPFGEKFIIYPEDLKKAASIKNYNIIPCQYGHKSCYIDADGMMYACSSQWKIGINYLEHGFEKSWDYLQKNIKCVTCRTINDFSLAFNLNPSIIKEIIKDVCLSKT